MNDVPREGLSGCRPSAKAKEVLVVFLMSLVFLLFNISSPSKKVFDESYYTLGANAIIHGHADSNSEHPPMGKYLIGAGMAMAGDDPMGWRVMPAVFGSLLLSVVFLWMLKLGRPVAWTAVALIVTNGFWFVMSRAAMLAIFELTFTVIGLYLLTERRHWLSGAAIGLAVACRWNATFALLLAVAYVVCGDGVFAAIKTSVSCACAYILTWLPLVGLHPVRFVQAQVYILNYHLHAIGNPTVNDKWYHWAVRTAPEMNLNSMVANPWVTLLGVIAVVVLLRSRHVVALAAIVFLLQWAITPRTFTYYYYYLDTLTMLSIAAAIVIGRYKLTIGKHEVRLCVPVVVLSAAWFITHYAAFSALESPYDALFQF
jgi:predicted membrane-bound dolichyl-phosphate-mannose-protein mannosyltransferase